MISMFCKNCGQQIEDNALVCSNCNTVTGNRKFCVYCGAENCLEAAFCMKCGRSFNQAAVTGDKSKVAAGLLGILLWGLGIHRFYLGYVGLGIVQIIVTLLTCGIGGIWGFIEGIMILTGAIDKDADGRSLKA